MPPRGSKPTWLVVYIEDSHSSYLESQRFTNEKDVKDYLLDVIDGDEVDPDSYKVYTVVDGSIHEVYVTLPQREIKLTVK